MKLVRCLTLFLSHQCIHIWFDKQSWGKSKALSTRLLPPAPLSLPAASFPAWLES